NPDQPETEAATMLKHHRVEPASKAALNLFFTISSDDGFRPDDILAIKIGTERFRNHDRSILLLVIFHYCNPRAADGQAGSIQSMYKAHLSAAAGAEADVCAARLEIIKVTAG